MLPARRTSRAREQKLVEKTFRGLVPNAPAADGIPEEESSEEEEEAAGPPKARSGVVAWVDVGAGHVFITPDDRGPLLVCVQWAVDDWVAMRPGQRVEYEVDSSSAPYTLQPPGPDGTPGALREVQQAWAVRHAPDMADTDLRTIDRQLERLAAKEADNEYRRIQKRRYKEREAQGSAAGSGREPDASAASAPA